MGTVFSSLGSTLLIAVLLVTAHAGYRAALPKPLPGIPYNRDAAGKLFGDIPEIMGYVIRTKRIFCWLTSLTTRHQSPIVQAFIKPMALPWVVVTDPLESQDILLRRTKEFDRSGFFGELIGGILPEQHIHMIKVWQLKCDVAKGRPFAAHHDITYMALDSIFAAMFGLPEPESITIQRLDAVSRWHPEIPAGVDHPVPFPDGNIPEVFAAALTLANSVTDTQLSPAPRLTSWVLRKFPYMKRATAIKDKYIRDKIEESVRLIDGGGDNENRQTALHSVLLRERDVAAKEGRQPGYRKRAIADEFFGFMLARHNTSATTVAWGVKLLTDNPAAQDRLRADLAAALPGGQSGSREVLRHANTIAFVVRQALRDTTVLGRRIPRDTDVFLMANGPGYLGPNMRVSDETRTPGARRQNGDIAAFRPERWLGHDPDTGDEMFDSMAGPSLAFGLGPRGCFSRRFALQELRIQFALIVWHLNLLKTPPELSRYDSVQRFAREPTQCYVRLSNANV
ncbi:hypothetical protein QBC33DRAFT_581676 [Phialemonium atrogriseum]|uniref:Uncharacterized protein n=1 Tax=Phialemonium atrogriseum TaxID=1093897 RepID=A0AAJ0FIX7_9PEZI|nr:uncharacterized protein QBC33DRAFT_581676 [Phialemonium atrogriseum]KAK1762540.1 hypothetical protein QBC33DRAFT_581676 [Phialemonium atrogriseum]